VRLSGRQLLAGTATPAANWWKVWPAPIFPANAYSCICDPSDVPNVSQIRLKLLKKHESTLAA